MLSKCLNVNLLCYCYYKNNKPSYLKSRRYVLKCRNYLLDNLVRIVYNYVILKFRKICRAGSTIFTISADFFIPL